MASTLFTFSAACYVWAVLHMLQLCHCTSVLRLYVVAWLLTRKCRCPCFSLFRSFPCPLALSLPHVYMHESVHSAVRLESDTCSGLDFHNNLILLFLLGDRHEIWPIQILPPLLPKYDLNLLKIKFFKISKL